MSHYFKSEDGTKFNYDSDMEGLVTVNGILIPGRAMIEFVAEYVRIERLTKSENQTPEEILDF